MPWIPDEFLPHGRFLAAAAPWILRGANVIPARADGKRPLWRFRHLYQPDAPRLTRSEYEHAPPDVAALILLSSARLVVVDVDDEADLPWALETFGETPLKVRTARGWHLYYSGLVHGRNGIGGRKVDVKSWGGYVVAPGSVHKSGREYAASLPYREIPDIELPAFREDAYTRICGASRSTRVKTDRPSGPPPTWQDAGILPANLEVHTASGVSQIADCSVGSKLHAPDREDEHPSCSLWRNDAGTLFLYDWSTSRRWKIEENPIDLSFGAPTRVIARLDGEYVEDTTTLVVGPVGCGKTESLLPAWRAAGLALLVTPTRALAVADATRVGASRYDEDPEAKKLVTTLASRHKVSRGRLDLYVADELPRLLGGLHSRIMRGRLRAFRQLVHDLATARRAVALGADITPAQVRMLTRAIRRIAPERRIEVLVVERPALRREISVATTGDAAGAFLRRVDAHEGGSPLVLVTDERREVEAIAIEVQRRRPDLRVACVHGKTDRSVLSDPDGILRSCDVLVCNHAMGDGVSFTAAVRAVFGLHRNRNVSAEAFLQLIARFRNVEEERVIVGLHKWQIASRPEREEVIERLCLSRAEEITDLASCMRPTFDGWRLDDEDFLAAWVLYESESARSWNDPLGSFGRAVQRYGWGLVRCEEHGEADLTAAREAVAEEETRAILEASDIDEHTAAELGQKYERTRGESATLDRYAIRNFFGRVDEDLARRDRNGGLREKIREYEHAKLEQDALLAVDLSGESRHPSELDGATLRARVVVALSREILGRDVGGSVTVSDLAPKVLAFYRRRRKAIRRAFPQISAPVEETAIRWVRARLESCGAKMRKDGDAYTVIWPSDDLGRRYRESIYRRLDRLIAA